MTFASALALGIEGADEVVDVVLERPVELELVRRRLDQQSPPGLVITDAKILQAQDPKPQVDRVSYEIRVPASRHEAVHQAVQRLLQQSSYRLDRPGRREPIDLRPAIDDLRLEGRLSADAAAGHTAGHAAAAGNPAGPGPGRPGIPRRLAGAHARST